MNCFEHALQAIFSRADKRNTMKKKIKVLVSTKQTQGQRKNDFSSVPEDELLTFVSGPCGDGEADDECGCTRSLVGIECRRGTTTAKVVERELTQARLARLFKQSADSAGWGKLGYTLERGREFAHAILSEAANFSTGTVVEFRNQEFKKRKLAA
jgi:hypothetical protein